MIIENKDSNSNPLQMCLITIHQTNVAQAESELFFVISSLPSLYRSDLNVHGPIIFTVVHSQPPKAHSEPQKTSYLGGFNMKSPPCRHESFTQRTM